MAWYFPVANGNAEWMELTAELEGEGEGDGSGGDGKERETGRRGMRHGQERSNIGGRNTELASEGGEEGSGERKRSEKGDGREGRGHGEHETMGEKRNR